MNKLEAWRIAGELLPASQDALDALYASTNEPLEILALLGSMVITVLKETVPVDRRDAVASRFVDSLFASLDTLDGEADFNRDGPRPPPDLVG